MDRRTFIAGAAAAGATLTARGASHSSPTGMSAWVVGDRQGIGALRRIDRPVPVAGSGEVLIKVRYSAINARDRGIVGGPFPPDIAPDRIPLSDGIGEVISMAEGVTAVQPGDRVICPHFLDWLDGAWQPDFYKRDVGTSVNGWLADYVVLPAVNLVKIPDSISDEQACTLPVAGVTAWHALFEVGRVQPGETVLSLGTGGVSSWGLALAKAAGARVVVTSSSDEKLAQMRGLGADFTVNYRKTPDWGELVQSLTGGGADVVMENVGRQTLDQSMIAAAVNGRVVMIGTGPLPKQLPTLPWIFQKNLMIRGISNASRRMLVDLVSAVAANDLRVPIARVFDFARADEAFQYMARSGHVGKVVIRHA